MHIIFDGTKYSEGDKIAFTITCLTNNEIDEDKYIGTLKFGIYNDNEEYVTFEHLGFYVEYKYKYWKEGLELSTETFPDVIKLYNGKLVK